MYNTKHSLPAQPLLRSRNWRLPALIAGLTLPLAVSALAAPATTDQALTRTMAQKSISGWSSVILKTRGQMTATQEAQITALGGDITSRLSIIQSVAVRLPARNLSRLAALPFASHLSLDGAVQKNDAFTVASSEANQASATDVYGKSYQMTGKGVTVAVLDSGITPLKDLNASPAGLLGSSSRIVASINYSTAIQGGATTIAAGSGGVGLSSGTGAINLLGGGTLISTSNNGNSYDPCGHGTHVAGIIAGNGATSSDSSCYHTFYGIAPQANLVNVRVLDQNGQTNVSTVITALQWTISDAIKYNIRVLNLSLGHPVGESYTTDPLCQAVEAAWNAGIVVVCAAGNNGSVSVTNTPGGTTRAGEPTTAPFSRPATIRSSSPSVPPKAWMATGRTTASPRIPAGDRLAWTWCSSPTSSLPATR